MASLILMSWSPLLDWVTVHKFSSVVQVDFHVLLCKRSKYASVVLHRLGWVTKIPSWSRATIATLQHTVVLGWVKKQNVGGAVQTSTGACQCAELLWDFFLCHQYLQLYPVVLNIFNFNASDISSCTRYLKFSRHNISSCTQWISALPSTPWPPAWFLSSSSL